MLFSSRCTALILLRLAVSAQSWAEVLGAQPFDCPSNPACHSLLQQAYEQSSHGNLDEAARLYKAANEVRADPGLLFNVARVLHNNGETQKAAFYYQQFLSSPSGDAKQKLKAQVYLNL